MEQLSAPAQVSTVPNRSPGDRRAAKAEEQLGVTEKCFCRSACVVARDVVCIGSPSAFIATLARALPIPLHCRVFCWLWKIFPVITPGSLRRAEPLTASHCCENTSELLTG